MNEKSSGFRSRKQRLTAVGTCCADHVTPLYPQKLALTSPTGGGRSVGIVCVRTKATEFIYIYRKVAGSIPADVSGFFIDIKSFRSHYGPEVDSASNINEYKEYFLGVKAAGA